MTIEPTEKQVLDEMEATGADDYFTVAARLERELTAAAAKAAKLNPQPADNTPWTVEPSEAAINEAMQSGLSYKDAHEAVKGELEADARRLAATSPDASEEISEAVAAALAAKEKAENLLAEHQASLENITAQILALGNLRKKIRLVEMLRLDDGEVKQLAHSALGCWVQMRGGQNSPQVSSGWNNLVNDLAWRTALNGHLDDFISPMQKNVTETIEVIRREAAAAKIDLGKVFELLSSERGKRGGQHLEIDSSLYKGLL